MAAPHAHATPLLETSHPLSLTESHLSAEATGPSLASKTPKVLRPPSLASSSTLDEPARRRGTAGEADALSSEKVNDLEKGEVGPAEPEVGRPKVLAADGSEVLIVDWNGEDDPAFPKNWTKRRRMGATLCVAAFTFLSPLSSTMIAPAVGQLSRKFDIQNGKSQHGYTSACSANDLHIRSGAIDGRIHLRPRFDLPLRRLTDLPLTLYVPLLIAPAYAFGPLFLGPMSEIWGRTIILQSANLIYLVFNLACGFATSSGQLLAFRFLAGIGGSAPLAIGAGVLGDLWRAEERGAAAALYSLGPLLGPAVGPVCGGWIAEKLPNDGYRWVFFSTTIACAAIQILGLLFLRETYAPTLLHRQALVLKKEMGLPIDSDKVQTVFEIKGGHKSFGHILSHGLVRPFVMLRKESIIQILSVYMAIIYGIIYITTVSTTDIFINIYHESVGIAGTNFVAQGLGFMIWAQIQGRLMDRVYRALKERNGGVGKPEFRLLLMIPASLFLPLGLLTYGWGAQHHVHWIVPDIGLFLIAAGMIGNFQSITTYLIDAFTLYAASALAAATCLRSLCGFGFPLFAPYLFASLGYGWGCTLLAGLAIGAGWPAAPILYKYGEKIRLRSSYTAKQAA